MRQISTCVFCRDRKKRCILTQAGKPCKACASKNLDCSLTVKKAISSSQTGRAEAPLPICPLPPSPRTLPEDVGISFASSSSDAGLPARDVCDELISLYFDLVHEKQHIIFHRSTFLRDFELGNTPEYLLFAIIALVARFSDNSLFEDTPRWDRARPWLQKGLQAFNSRSTLINTSSVQGAILLAFVAFVEGQVDQDSLLAAQAIRMVQVLELPLRLSPDPVQQEIEIRLYWQTWMMDIWYSARTQLPQQLRNDPRFIKPLDESTISSLTDQTSQAMAQEGGSETSPTRLESIWTAIIPLQEIHIEVFRLNNQAVDRPAFHFELENRVEELSLRLDFWLENLPLRLQHTPSNITHFANLGLAREFAVIHILYHFQSQLLYYQFLAQNSAVAGSTSANHKISKYAALCQAHAEAMSQIMWNLHSNPGTECLWSPVNGHLLVVASSIHLYTFLSNTNETHHATAGKLLEQNFKMLSQFREYWPSVEFSMSRLRAVHRACQVNFQTQSSFHMDHWMLQFLSRYESPMSDRENDSTLESAKPYLNSIDSPDSRDELWHPFTSDHSFGS